MNTTLNRVVSLAGRLLPAVRAEALCTSAWEYRCLCAGCGTPRRRQRRACTTCDGKKTCGAWSAYGTCPGDTCC